MKTHEINKTSMKHLQQNKIYLDDLEVDGGISTKEKPSIGSGATNENYQKQKETADISSSSSGAVADPEAAEGSRRATGSRMERRRRRQPGKRQRSSN